MKQGQIKWSLWGGGLCTEVKIRAFATPPSGLYRRAVSVQRLNNSKRNQVVSIAKERLGPNQVVFESFSGPTKWFLEGGGLWILL